MSKQMKGIPLNILPSNPVLTENEQKKYGADRTHSQEQPTISYTWADTRSIFHLWVCPNRVGSGNKETEPTKWFLGRKYISRQFGGYCSEVKKEKGVFINI